MIKETVDAVRVAELEAEQTITTARENALDHNNQIKNKAEVFRAKAIAQAKSNAEKAMQNTVQKCDEYSKNASEAVEETVKELKNSALEKTDKAIDAVINALI